MLEYIQEFIDADLSVMDMHHVVDGVCQCGVEDCKAQFKHPKNQGWRTMPHDYANNSMAFWDDFPDFAPQSCGWVLGKNHIVIDVDPRNGGMASLERLEKDLGYKLSDKTNSIVETGGDGLHFYFSKDEDVLVSKAISGYEGIDIKTNGGFVIIAGSMHQSGNTYEWQSLGKSSLEFNKIPEGLLELCKAKVVERVESSSSEMGDWIEALTYIDPDIDYEDWIRVGMAVHHITDGEGFDQWDNWSQGGSKYNANEMDAKWHSFGKSSNIVTESTLFHYAKAGGYITSVGIPEVELQDEAVLNTPVPLLSQSELMNPGGLLGDLVDHINTNCLFKRRWAAVGVAMSALSSVIGQRMNTIFDTRFNMINVIVADSSTGKEALLSGARDILDAVGITEIIYGGIKSEQEIYRNLIRHQVAMYMIDEFGLQLAKIKNSSSNGASYHEGTIATILSAFTKANKHLDVTGDLKFEMLEALNKQIATIEIGLSENKWEDSVATKKQAVLEQLKIDRTRAKDGIYQPYLGLCGFTTPNTFESSVNEDSIMQGDVGRMLIFKEYDSNPMPDMNYKGRKPIPDGVKERLRAIYNEFASANETGRVEYDGTMTNIKFADSETESLYRFVYQWFYSELADRLKDDGMQAVARRSPELMNKVLGLLACEGSITIKDIQYAFSLVYYDLQDKRRIATISRGSKSKHKDEILNSMKELILGVCRDSKGATPTEIRRKCNSFKREDVDKMIAHMEANGEICKKDSDNHRLNRYTICS